MKSFILFVFWAYYFLLDPHIGSKVKPKKPQSNSWKAQQVSPVEFRLPEIRPWRSGFVAATGKLEKTIGAL